MTSTTHKEPARAAVRWPRAAAVEAFGARYVQRRTWRDPVVEALGAAPAPEELLDGCRCFQSPQQAVQRAQADAREEATRELERLDEFMRPRAFRLRLALARTWRVARNRERGILATVAILEQRRREQHSILRNGLGVSVRRLPDVIRLPALFPLGQIVHVVDTRAFPREALRIVGRPILTHSFVEAPSHPEFDLLVRYRVGDLDGLGYDHPESGTPKLDGAPAGVEVFLDAGDAERYVAEYATGVMARLGRPDAPLPPVERVVEASPEPEGSGEAVPSAPPAESPAPGRAAASVAAPDRAVAAPGADAPERPVAPTPGPSAAPAAAVGLADDVPSAPTPSEPAAEAVAPSPPVAAAAPVPAAPLHSLADAPPAAGGPLAPVDARDPVEGIAIDRSAPSPAPIPVPEATGAGMAEDGPGAPSIAPADVRPAKARRGLLDRLFRRKPRDAGEPPAAPDAGEPLPSPPGADPGHLLDLYPEAGPGPFPSPSFEPAPPAAPRVDHLPEGMILDEMERAVVELAAAAARAQRPSLPAAPVHDRRHPETSAFLSRGGLILLTAAEPGESSPALRLLGALAPGAVLEDAPDAPDAPDASGPGQQGAGPGEESAEPTATGPAAADLAA